MLIAIPVLTFLQIMSFLLFFSSKEKKKQHFHPLQPYFQLMIACLTQLESKRRLVFQDHQIFITFRMRKKCNVFICCYSSNCSSLDIQKSQTFRFVQEPINISPATCFISEGHAIWIFLHCYPVGHFTSFWYYIFHACAPCTLGWSPERRESTLTLSIMVFLR